MRGIREPLAILIIPQPNRKNQKTRIRSNRDQSKQNDDIPTRPEPLQILAVVADRREELAVALLPAQQADGQHAGAVCREQRADAVELGREDLEHDQREAELRQRGPHVRALERPLRRPHLDQLLIRQDDGARAVAAVVVSLRGRGSRLGMALRCQFNVRHGRGEGEPGTWLRGRWSSDSVGGRGKLF